MSTVSRVVATDRKHLIQLIEQAMGTSGAQCDLNHIDVSRITNMSVLFSQSTFNGNISQWDTSNVTDMSAMFYASKFNSDIAQWNLSNVANMRSMFEASQFNNDISKWDTSGARTMGHMFSESIFMGDISGWNVSNVTNMYGMFSKSNFNGDVSNWRFMKLESACSMFEKAAFRGDLSKWRFARNVDFEHMLDPSVLTEYTEPCSYHWQCAAKNLTILAGRPDWQQHYIESVGLADMSGVTNQEQILYLVHAAWLNKQTVLSKGYAPVNLPVLD